MKPFKQKWLMLQDDDCIHVVPDSDTKPHGYPKRGQKTVLADMNCPCKPDIEFWKKGILIGHKSFRDQEKIDKAMASLFLHVQ